MGLASGFGFEFGFGSGFGSGFGYIMGTSVEAPKKELSENVSMNLYG